MFIGVKFSEHLIFLFSFLNSWCFYPKSFRLRELSSVRIVTLIWYLCDRLVLRMTFSLSVSTKYLFCQSEYIKIILLVQKIKFWKDFHMLRTTYKLIILHITLTRFVLLWQSIKTNFVFFMDRKNFIRFMVAHYYISPEKKNNKETIRQPPPQ